MTYFYITRAHLKGFRNIQDTETTFREGLNIIIGPNGCGKSNFLWLLSNINNNEINDIDISAEIDWFFYSSEKLINTYETKIKHQNESNPFTQNFEIKKIIDTVEYANGERDDDNHTLKNEVISPILIPFNIPTIINCFSNSNSVEINIENNKFSNVKILGMALYEQINIDNWFVKKISPTDLNFKPSTLEALRKYTPIQNVRVKKVVSDDDIKETIKETRKEIKVRGLHYEFQIHNEWFDWRDLSDGTRRIVFIVLAVLAIVGGPIVIEEPELGIHPDQLRKLMQFLKEQSKEKQIIISTHSPEVLNILDEDELDRIKVARYDEERGTTVIEGLSEKKQASIVRYFKKTGLLSSYWVHIGLDNKKKNV